MNEAKTKAILRCVRGFLDNALQKLNQLDDDTIGKINAYKIGEGETLGYSIEDGISAVDYITNNWEQFLYDIRDDFDDDIE